MILFEPYTAAGLKLKNSLVRAATYEKMADEDGYVTPRLIELYRSLAIGGSGLIITGAALVHPTGRYLRRMLSAHSDLYTKGLTELAGAVHDEGGVIALQLDHGGRQCPALMLGGDAALAPSDNPPCPVTGAPVRGMQDHEIWTMTEAFASAAYRARTAGFDAIEIQAAHGYLISSFLSPYTNRRDDYWGGDHLRRVHFMEETVKAVRKSVGDDYPIIVKLNADDHIVGGLTIDDALYNANVAVDAGATIVEVSGGMRQSPASMLPPKDMQGFYLEAGVRFKAELNIPVIVTGGFGRLLDMNSAIERGAADMVGMSRALIRQPALPNLMQQGAESADCVRCSECMKYSRLKYVRCVKLDN